MLNAVLWGIAVNTTALAVLITHWYRTSFKNDEHDVPKRPELVLKSIETNKPIYYFGVGSNMVSEISRADEKVD
jgi:hypothetical protein